MKQGNANLSVGTPWKILLAYTLPLLGSAVFQQIYTIADTVIAGKFAGESALAAVGASMSIVNILMAVALGVADKVIEQLKVAMPELIDDPDFIPAYYWYYVDHSGMGSPADVFSGAIHDASVAAIANSVDASGSGGGGGFSSGGGGGFGGGGGGGAF